MNNNILVFAGSNATNSINQWFAKGLGELANVDYFDIRKLDLPLFNTDIEEKTGIPKDVQDFYTMLRTYKKVILVSPEYNGYTPAYLKSFLDWISRLNRFYFEDIELVLVAVVPGKKAGVSVREMLSKMLSFTKANEVGSFGIAHFDQENDYHETYLEIINSFK